MDYYHGSTIKGLTELIPYTHNGNNLKEPLVYLTTSKQLALHYIWDYKRLSAKCPMLDIRKDGTLVFQEMFSGALEYLYQGLSGYIYHCVGEYASSGDAGVISCVTVNQPIPVSDYEWIGDVYDSIMTYAEKGTFIYEKYEDLPRWRHDVIRGIIIRNIKRNNMLNDLEHPDRKLYQEKYPVYWQEAQVLYEHGIL